MESAHFRLLPLAAGVHVVEEYVWPGGFIDVMNDTVPRFARHVTTRFAVVPIAVAGFREALESGQVDRKEIAKAFVIAAALQAVPIVALAVEDLRQAEISDPKSRIIAGSSPTVHPS